MTERDDEVRSDLESADVTLRVPRDQHTRVIAYGPDYAQGRPYDVVVLWPGHQRLNFSGIGTGEVRTSEFDPLDPTPTGTEAEVQVIIRQDGARPRLVPFLLRREGFTALTCFDLDINRLNAVTLTFISWAE